MTFLEVFIAEVEANYAGGVPIWFAPADNPEYPFIAMLIVPPNAETPNTFGSIQGQGGEIQLQWSLATHDSQPEAYAAMETLKNTVQAIRGKLGTAPNEYYVDANRTDGQQNFDSQLGTWSMIFESFITWTKV